MNRRFLVDSISTSYPFVDLRLYGWMDAFTDRLKEVTVDPGIAYFAFVSSRMSECHRVDSKASGEQMS